MQLGKTSQHLGDIMNSEAGAWALLVMGFCIDVFVMFTCAMAITQLILARSEAAQMSR